MLSTAKPQGCHQGATTSSSRVPEGASGHQALLNSPHLRASLSYFTMSSILLEEEFPHFVDFVGLPESWTSYSGGRVAGRCVVPVRILLACPCSTCEATSQSHHLVIGKPTPHPAH